MVPLTDLDSVCDKWMLHDMKWHHQHTFLYLNCLMQTANQWDQATSLRYSIYYITTV